MRLRPISHSHPSDSHAPIGGRRLAPASQASASRHLNPRGGQARGQPVPRDGEPPTGASSSPDELDAVTIERAGGLPAWRTRPDAFPRTIETQGDAPVPLWRRVLWWLRMLVGLFLLSLAAALIGRAIALMLLAVVP